MYISRCASRQIVVAIDLVDLLAEILEAHLGVGLGMRLDQRRQGTCQRRVGVVEILEVEELGDQRAPLALGDAHREQHQERIEPGLLDLDAPRRQELRRPRAAGMPMSCMVAVCGKPGRQDGDLDRVDQDVVVGEVLEAMPRVARASAPSRRLVVGRALGHRVRLPDVEPP